jgi:hypothetical protein
MWFRDGANKGTASNFVQISETVRQKPWQWLDKLAETENGVTGED